MKGAEPPRLLTYRQNNPQGTWPQFCRDSARKKQVQTQIKTDQGGLCAYCEIDFEPDVTPSGYGDADFRVEHFHPKSDSSSNHNWHLDWNNLLGCCHGGSQRAVVNASDRFTSPDHSCDVPKEDANLDDIILNPLTIPASLPLFKVSAIDGEISVNHANCVSLGISPLKAQATIDHLCLNAARLKRLRKTVLDALKAKMQENLGSNQNMEHLLTMMTSVFLSKDTQQKWPAFFTTIRDYFASAAETHLQRINFNG